MTDMVKLGQFEVTSGKLRVTDPCYDRSIWCSGYVDAENGTWEAFVYMSDQGAWGNRVSALEVRRVGENEAPDRLVSFEVGVDSGQAGFFDDAFYPEGDDNGEYGNTDTFYGKVCEITLSDKRAGVLPFGAVSSSGYGDGGYDCFVLEKNGKVVAARIVFISEEGDEDYFEDDEEDMV